MLDVSVHGEVVEKEFAVGDMVRLVCCQKELYIELLKVTLTYCDRVRCNDEPRVHRNVDGCCNRHK